MYVIITALSGWCVTGETVPSPLSNTIVLVLGTMASPCWYPYCEHLVSIELRLIGYFGVSELGLSPVHRSVGMLLSYIS